MEVAFLFAVGVVLGEVEQVCDLILVRVTSHPLLLDSQRGLVQ